MIRTAQDSTRDFAWIMCPFSRLMIHSLTTIPSTSEPQRQDVWRMSKKNKNKEGSGVQPDPLASSTVTLAICDVSPQKWPTSSTAQGGGGSFKNRKPIGEVGCCESRMAGRSHWWIERWLMSPLFLSFCLSFSDCLSIYRLSIYLSLYIYLSLSLYQSIDLSLYRSIDLSIWSICLSVYLSTCLSVYLSTYLPIYLSTYLSTYLPTYLSIHLSIYPSIHLSIYLSIYRSIYLSSCLSI